MSKNSQNKTKSLTEVGDPIKDIIDAMDHLEKSCFYNNGYFEISKEVYNYLIQDHVPILTPKQLKKFQKESEKVIRKDMRERWGLEKAVKKFLSKRFDLDDKDYELVWKPNHEEQT